MQYRLLKKLYHDSSSLLGMKLSETKNDNPLLRNNIIVYIALGMVLSLAFGVEYDCVGSELFSQYYGSPFVFMRQSLASSLEFNYSILGLILNVLLWSVLIFFIRNQAFRILSKSKVKSKNIIVLYNLLGVFLIGFSSVIITSHLIFLENSFSENSNYWYFGLDAAAEKWGLECDCKPILFKM